MLSPKPGGLEPIFIMCHALGRTEIVDNTLKTLTRDCSVIQQLGGWTLRLTGLHNLE